MRAPSLDLRPIPPAAAPSSRVVSFVLVALLHVVIIYALAAGLAHQMIELLPQNVKVAIIPPTQEKVTPPPPPPQFKQPPPFVPPPDVTIDLTQAAPATNAITAQSAQKGITAPASVGRTHYCDPTRYYPPQGITNNWTGTTVLAFRIGTDGTVKDLQVKQSSGHPELDEGATRCASSWRYSPAMQNGQAIEVPWQTNVRWSLKG
jgi:protein TonB